jgi:hypothetical protein
LATRAHLAAGGDHYLAPLSLTQLPQAAIDAYLQAVWVEEQALKPLPASQSPDCASLMVANSAPSRHSQPGRADLLNAANLPAPQTVESALYSFVKMRKLG